MKQENLVRIGKQLLYIGLVFGALLIVLSAIERKQESTVRELFVNVQPLPDGNRLLVRTDVEKTLDVSFDEPMVGGPMQNVNVTRIEQVLEEDPFILDADAYLNARNELHIEVVQRKPILRIMDNSGLNYYLDASGQKMPLSKHFTARVPVATGNIPPHVPEFYEREKYVLTHVFELVKLIRKDVFFQPLVEQIHVNQRGEMTLVPKVGRQKIVFGEFADAKAKLRRLKIFYQEGMPREGWRKYKTINVKFDGQVVCEK